MAFNKAKWTVTLTLRQASRLGAYKRPWVARITGRSTQYQFAREFVGETSKVFGGEWKFALGEGLYETCDRNSKGAERRYWTLVEGGKARTLSDAEFGEVFDGLFPPTLEEELRAAVTRNPEDQAAKSVLADHLRDHGRDAEADQIFAQPQTYTCLECGYETTREDEIDAGGMGCRRCNH